MYVYFNDAVSHCLNNATGVPRGVARCGGIRGGILICTPPPMSIKIKMQFTKAAAIFYSDN